MIIGADSNNTMVISGYKTFVSIKLKLKKAKSYPTPIIIIPI